MPPTHVVRRVVAVALALVVLAAPAAADAARADPPTESLDATALPLGRLPSFAFLAGRTLVLPNGKRVTLRLPASHADSLELLGKSGSSYVVLDRSDRSVFYRVAKSGRVSRFLTRGNVEALDYFLSRDGKRILELEVDRSAYSTATVFDLKGKEIDSSGYDGYASLLDFDGTRAVLNAEQLWSWTPGSKPIALTAGHAGLADLAHDVLFVAAGDAGVGPTTVSAPGPPAWSAAFRPRAVSPDGTYVAGIAEDDKTVQVRRMSDGALVRAVTGGFKSGRALLWDASTLVIGVKIGRRSALVRCPVAGACTRATALTKGSLSTPLDYARFGD